MHDRAMEPAHAGPGPARVEAWLPGPLSPEAARGIERLAHAEDVRRVAVMPDAHWAEDVCVGTVVATRRLLLPAAVGGDIGCGVATIPLGARADLLADERHAARLLAALERTIPAIRHGRDSVTESLPPALAALPLSDAGLEGRARRDGRFEWATLGRGNHFLEIQRDEEDRLWAMVHTGSRAMGPAIRAHHLALARPVRGGLHALDAESEEGRRYLADMAWALTYAETSREAILAVVGRLVADLFGIEPGAGEIRRISCHHNFVRREEHDGEALWVHRKGAISAREGEAGLVPGSMGAPTFHVEGRGIARSLCSTSHGAGRAFSRAEARRRIGTRDLERQMRGVFFDHRRLDALRDEAPAAYKEIGAVMRAQRDLTRIVRRVEPLLSYKP